MKTPREDKALTHKPGIAVVIPKTLWTLTAYPTRLLFTSLKDQETKEVLLPLAGPVEGFTVEVDYKRNKVSVFGRAKEGYYRLRAELQDNELVLTKEKGPGSVEDKSLVAALEKEEVVNERLYLGCNKVRVFEKVRERASLEEVLPLWYSLGKNAPKAQKEEGAVLDLFTACEKTPSKELFLHLYKAAFSEGFVPRGKDEEHQGILPGKDSVAAYLLSAGAALIRSLFFKEEKEGYILLRDWLPDLPYGKIDGIKSSLGDLINFTWSKGKLFTVSIHPSKSHEIKLTLPKEIRSFRVKTSSRDKGRKVLPGEKLSLEPGKALFLDRFEK